MFEMISSFFQSIGDFFSKIWDFITMIWEEITQFFRILAPALNFFRSLLNSLPPVFLAFGVAMLVVLILYIILGRNAGGD